VRWLAGAGVASAGVAGAGVVGAASAAAAVWLLARTGGLAGRRLRPVSPGKRDRPNAVMAVVRRRRLDSVRNAEAVTLCAALAAELRAGLPPGPALASAAGELPSLGPRLGRAARAVGRGALLGEELALAGVDEQCARLAAVAAVCAAGEATGSGIADVLDRVGSGFATDDQSKAELAALAAGPRATTVVLAGLPAVAVAMGTALGLAPLRILFHTALGMGLWLAAALLEMLGIIWVRRITAAALRG
jgi:tight adherence protein B